MMYYDLLLDVDLSGCRKQLQIKKGEVDSRTIRIELCRGTFLVVLDSKRHWAMIKGIKADKTVLVNPGTIEITYAIVQRMTIDEYARYMFKEVSSKAEKLIEDGFMLEIEQGGEVVRINLKDYVREINGKIDEQIQEMEKTKDSAIEQIDSTVNKAVSNVENAKNVAMSLFYHNEQTVKTSSATQQIEVNAPYVRVKVSSSDARIEFQNEYQQTINKEFYSGSIDEIIDLSKYGTTEYDVKYIRIFTNNASTAEETCLGSAIAEIYIIEQEHLKYVVNKIAEFDQKRVDSIAKINNATTESKNSIDSLTISSQKGISSLTEAKSNDIATLTTAKMKDIANVTNAKIGDINNTASAQISNINNVAYQNTKSGIEAVNATANAQIDGIETVANAQIGGIAQTAQGKIKGINNTATSQISAINNTATNQIKAINNTAISQIENMTVKYSDMCRILGIEHEGIMLANTSYNGSSIPEDIYSIDVSKFKHIEFGKLVMDDNYEFSIPPLNISSF